MKPTHLLFHAGKIAPRRSPKPCREGWHAGPLLNAERYENAEWPWSGMGECAACGSTIRREDIRRPVVA